MSLRNDYTYNALVRQSDREVISRSEDYFANNFIYDLLQKGPCTSLHYQRTPTTIEEYRCYDGNSKAPISYDLLSGIKFGELEYNNIRYDAMLIK